MSWDAQQCGFSTLLIEYGNMASAYEYLTTTESTLNQVVDCIVTKYNK